MLRFFHLLPSILLLVPVFAHAVADQDTLFQVSTIDALLSGLYQGELRIRSIITHVF